MSQTDDFRGEYAVDGCCLASVDESEDTDKITNGTSVRLGKIGDGDAMGSVYEDDFGASP